MIDQWGEENLRSKYPYIDRRCDPPERMGIWQRTDGKDAWFDCFLVSCVWSSRLVGGKRMDPMRRKG